MILSIVGGVIGTVVTLVIVAASLAGPIVPVTPTETPSSTASEQPMPSDSSEPTEERPSPEQIANDTKRTFQADGLTGYDDMPEFYPCMGEQLYASDLSDETLSAVINGGDPVEAERAAAEQVITDAILTCDPEGEGAF
jgi:hypothetical protein